MANSYQFSKVFTALNGEIAFTSEILSSGIEQLRKADYSRKGSYFQSFSSISIGLERLGKLCILFDHAIHHNLQFPDDSYMRQVGHSIVKIYDLSENITTRNGIALYQAIDLSEEIYIRILRALDSFAKGDRYSNINLLTNSTSLSDPIADWHTEVDGFIYDSFVSLKTKSRIQERAQQASRILSGHVSVLHISETGGVLADIYSAAVQTGKSEAILSTRQMYLIRLIRYMAQILEHLVDAYSRASGDPMPSISDYLGIYYNTDSYLKKRRVIGFR